MSLLSVDFAKYQGLGNDFIIVDNRQQNDLVFTPEEAKRLCNRRFGIGGDGIIFAMAGEEGCEYGMRILNADGSEPEMCGNAIRCLAKYLHKLQGHKRTSEYRFFTKAGPIVAEINEDSLVTVEMGAPRLCAIEIPTLLASNTDEGLVVNQQFRIGNTVLEVTCVSMGNPHAVVFVDDLSKTDFDRLGAVIETHDMFPNRVNVEFVQVLSENHAVVKVWERGVGPTLACGTGACAVLVAGVLTGRLGNSCVVSLPGGDLKIEWADRTASVKMTGPALEVFHGSTPAP